MSIIDDYNKLFTKKMAWVTFISVFRDDNYCLELYFKLKYWDKNCTKCERSIVTNYARVIRTDKNGIIKKSFRCKSCKTTIYPLSDTIFRRSHLPISLIFILIFVMATSKKNSSAVNISNIYGGSYKYIHLLMMRIRSVMVDDLNRKLKGHVEIDEMFVGKGSKVYNWSGMSTRKQPILGMIERDTKQAKVFLVNSRSKKTLRELILKNIEVDSTIYTDSWKGYEDLNIYYDHHMIDHTKREFVRGDIHTNTIENLWGGFKRNIRGAHIKISAKYVGLYMNELCWKNNHKNYTEMQKFDKLLKSTFQVIPAR